MYEMSSYLIQMKWYLCEGKRKLAADSGDEVWVHWWCLKRNWKNLGKTQG